ncbi:unnamed protein product [Cuscuta campestris]|uniref:cytokinin riboside 5'-monophosphate phosphoribohydrolase n=1 Tax=Cuscuta campestris TaxID=132261 RepID=A0A484KHS8_9ASTE|nr:unnamed protein product [Cuscuta campestris]
MSSHRAAAIGSSSTAMATTPPSSSVTTPATKSFKEAVCPSSPQIHTKQIENFKGLPCISFSNEEVLSLASRFQFALVGSFFGKRPPLEIIRKWLEKIGFVGFSVGLLHPAHVLINFSSEKDYQRLFLRKDWNVQGATMNITKWTTDFDPNKLGLGFDSALQLCNNQIWAFWNSDSLTLESSFSYTQLGHLTFTNKALQTKLHISTIYGKHTKEERRDLWHCISTLSGSINEPWLLGGDFNAISSLSHHKGKSTPCMVSIMEFDTCITQNGLIEPPFSGSPFTWHGSRSLGKIWRRLDRLFLNSHLDNLNCLIFSEHLAKGGSDHSPILLKITNGNFKGPFPFKFLNCWTANPSFLTLIKDNWEPYRGGGMRGLMDKLVNLRKVIQAWNKNTFGNILKNRTKQEDKLKLAEEAYNDSPTHDNNTRMQQAKSDLNKCLAIEYSYWKQKSNLKWVKEGDLNTKFFQAFVKNKRNFQRIQKIRNTDNNWLTEWDDIASEATSFFNTLFTHEETDLCPEILDNIPLTLNPNDNLSLCSLPTMEEVKTAIWDLCPDSSPGPDDDLILFTNGSGPNLKQVHSFLRNYERCSGEEDQEAFFRNRQITFKEAYLAIQPEEEEEDVEPLQHMQIIWNMKQIPKISFFQWRLHQKLLPFPAHLRKFGITSLPSICHLCKRDSDTDYHTLFQCPYAKPIWSYFEWIFKIPWQATNGVRAYLHKWWTEYHNQTLEGWLKADCSIGEYILIWRESTFLYVFRLVIITFPSMVQFQSLYISNCGKSVSHSHIMEGTSRALPNTIRFVGLHGSHALGSNPRFMATAVDLGRELVRRKIRLTYGGGNVGLQGAVASTIYNNGGRVRGFIPGYIATRGVYGPTYGAEYTVSSNYYKYFEMNHIVEAFIVLPGGIDTMEGLFTLISWASEGLHNKPIGLLNINGYFNNLIKFLDDAVRQNFMALNQRKLFISSFFVDELLDKLEFVKAFPGRLFPCCKLEGSSLFLREKSWSAVSPSKGVEARVTRVLKLYRPVPVSFSSFFIERESEIRDAREPLIIDAREDM